MEHSFYKLVFFGTSDFAVPILERLVSEKWKIVAVITQPDRPKGREGKLSPTPVKIAAEKMKLPIHELPSLKSEEAKDFIKSLRADLGLVVSYGVIIPGDVLRMARLGFVNIHPSLLPKYRGPSPIQTAILNGEIATGTSIMVVDEKMDHGPIIAQEEVAIKDSDDYTSLHNRLAEVSSQLLAEKLPKWILGNLKETVQDDRRATFTKTLNREDGKINWKKPAEAISRQLRAFSPWPGVWTNLNGVRHKILKARPAEDAPELACGQILSSGTHLFVGCGNKTTLEIKRLQPEGKKQMNAEEFLRGRDLQGQFFI